MSFGKAYSPFKKVVDEAVKYAESKGVILIHAAGNDSKNNDVLPSFPQKFHRKENREMNNWLEIGASSFQRGEQLPAVFSNYGKKSVDVFAPGVDIFSTTPENTYDTYSGTSMATPAVAGAAALILSYQPNLNANELKALILDTSRRYPQLRVQLPGAQTKVLFSDLSVHGSVADVFEATKSLK
jgi:subtilisin family serine protease